jgi:hypothetical protein
VNSKEHVLRLALVERELRAVTDTELATLASATSSEVQQWLAGLCGTGDGTFDAQGLRGALKRGRMKGVPDRVSAALTDVCLTDCIEVLGDRSNLPSEDDLRSITPGLVERHGKAVTRLMLASAALSEAPAAAAIVKVLKADPALVV